MEAIALDTTGSSVIPVDANLQPLDDYYLWCDHRAKKEAQEITETAHRESLRRLIGVVACIRTNGDSQSFCTGCGTILKNATSWELRLNIATWWQRRCAA